MFQVILAKKVKELLRKENGDDAFQIVLENKSVIQWKDEERWNSTLIHWAVFENQSDFLQQMLNNENVR